MNFRQAISLICNGNSRNGADQDQISADQRLVGGVLVFPTAEQCLVGSGLVLFGAALVLFVAGKD